LADPDRRSAVWQPVLRSFETMAAEYSLFDTAIGRCAIAWGDRGIASVTLPGAREKDTRASMLARFPRALEATPPPSVQRATESIAALLRGEASDLSTIAIDMDGVPPFYRRVYEVARSIPPGGTLSYGEIAARLGAPGSARAVGQALGRNPFAIVVPCHRVLAAQGRVGGFSAKGGITTKLHLLSIEDARANDAGGLSDGEVGLFAFDSDVAIRHLRCADGTLARVIDAVGPFRMRLAKTPSVFVALARAIVYQQLNGNAAATIFARVRALFPRAAEGPTPAQILRASDEKLRAAGLSRAKLLSLRDLALKVTDGTIPPLAEVRKMNNEAIIEKLTEVRGIGRWTVEMFLMFRLGRPDVLPVDDYGIRKGFAVAFGKRGLADRKDLERRGARWKPYRTVASWYLWRATELAKNTKE
jgi:O-6-methylguanine DNA methyltransferase